jgi:DeoR family transcriptional regulator of aga operon/DeoR family fructose operon transcriptional repressor
MGRDLMDREKVEKHMANLTADRRNRMAQILIREGSIKVGEMAERFGVSTETIRKDIIYLEEMGIAEKNYGGAIPKIGAVEKPLNEKEWVHAEEKAEIAAKAVSLIHKHDVILLDAGSTTSAIAKQLTIKQGLTIITNSLDAATLLSESEHQVFLCGGKIRRSSHALIGGWVLDRFKNIRADIAFLGSDGFKHQNGPTTVSYDESSVKAWMLHAAKRTYVVADSTKCTTTAQFSYADWQDVDGIITAGDHVDTLRTIVEDATQVIDAATKKPE